MLFADLGEQEPSQTSSWNEHVQRLQGMIPKLYDCSHDGRMTREGLQGEYADQGVVMQQLNKQMKDAEKPQWQLHVDPFYRYEQFAKKLEERYRGARILENMHPVVRRTLALRKPDGDRSEVMLQRTLLKIDGKNIETRFAAFDFVPPPQAAEVLLPTPGDRKRAIPEPEVARRASCKSESLQAMLSKQIDEHVQRSSSSTAFDDERWVPISPSRGFAELAETQWDIMTEKHLSPAQRAELIHVRNMITSLKQQISSLNGSLEAFQRAERELLTNTKC